MLISGRFEVLRKSDMKPSMPFLDLVARVPLRDLVPEEKVGRASAEERAGRGSGGSGEKGRSGAEMGTERRLAATVAGVGKRSLRVAVFAREGRGGGAAMGDDFAGANGSWSTRVVGGTDAEALCLRARGGGFWRELRTLGEPSTGVFDLKAGGGGGGGGRAGTKAGSW